MTKKMVIFKYGIGLQSHHNLPLDIKILSLQMQHHVPTMWVLFDDNAPKVRRSFAALPTGVVHNPGELKEFIGTLQTYNDDIVLHFFEIENEKDQES